MVRVTKVSRHDYNDGKIIKCLSQTRIMAQSHSLDMEGSKPRPSHFKVLVNLRHKLFIVLNKVIPLSNSSLLAGAINMAVINSGAEGPIK